MATFAEIQTVKNRHKQLILSRPNVVGVGTGFKVTAGQLTDNVCVVALVRQKVRLSELPVDSRVPHMLDGVITDVLEVGDLIAFQTPTDRWRPAPPGVSIGHYRITAGTFGCVVRDRNNGARLILSNNHVLANENDAQIGDAILQPGPADHGINPQDQIATLLRFVPLHYEGETSPPSCSPLSWLLQLAQSIGLKRWVDSLQKPVAVNNLVDAAVALPLNDSEIKDEILGIGQVSGLTTAELGMNVRKSGRTTGLTTGQITILDSTVTVGCSGGRTARFDNQIITNAMSRGGDSGSLLVTASDPPQAVGLLFAGSDQVTIYNPIQIVLDSLQINLG